MKTKSKNLMILLAMGFIFSLLIPNNLNFSAEHNTFNNLENSQVYSGIQIDALATTNTTYSGNWTWAVSQPWCYDDNGIYIIENMTIDASSSSTGSGIIITNSKNDYFIIRNCTVYNVVGSTSSYNAGIKLENTNNGTLVENNCSNNKGRGGIFLYRYCYNNIIANNTSNNNLYLGIGLYGWVSDSFSGCKNNFIVNNTANYNNIGIYESNYCENNTLIDNDCNFNFHPTYESYGIRIFDSYKTTLINNTVNNNGKHGIYLSYSNYCNITGSITNGNIKHGIYMDYSVFCNITGNTINDNTATGINLRRCDKNVVKNNTINRNDLGIALDQSDSNNISGNTLKDNKWCIYEIYSEGNIIEYNNCSLPTVTDPINIDGTATGVGAHNWTWAESQYWCSGFGTDNEPYIIENLIISGFGVENSNGIDIRNSNVSFIIQNCKIYNTETNGIYMENVNNSQLINNNCSNIEWGIFIE
ncbi:MAG: right-handed parallel beta-helix repeat-containing protein, partial [Candidatus Thorarchaeota archaeon]